MPSLFDQISGFQFPDVLMNSGPLPSTAGGPAGSDGSVDGVINGTGALLDNITPYAVGKSARTGSDRNYQQIPHRYQYIIPKIWLPDFYSERHHGVSHAVDQGDIAFLLYAGSRAWWTSKEQFATRAPQCAFAGIDVVNYILACLQASQTGTWQKIRRDLIQDDDLYQSMHYYARGEGHATDLQKDMSPFLVFQAVRMLVQQYFVPHGICAGSEKQGGQHEHVGGQPVLAPVNFVITMTVDGKNIDLVNYWYDKSVLAGDELIFRLEKTIVKRPFTLCSYYKDPQSQSIDTLAKECWQLVPDILRADPKEKQHDPVTAENAWRHHKCQGYWRVAQTFQTRAKNSVDAFHRGTPLEVTFAPVWQSFVYCRNECSYGNFRVEPVVRRFDKTTDFRQLCSVARGDSLTFYYADASHKLKEAFKMQSSQNHYSITFCPQVCKVYQDNALVVCGQSICKHELQCLHLIFDENVKATAPQNYRVHDKQAFRPSYIEETIGNYRLALPHTTRRSVELKNDLPFESGVSGEYLVTLTVCREPEASLYSADFIRPHLKRDAFMWNGDVIVCNDNAYVSAVQYAALTVLVEYYTDHPMRKHGAHASLAEEASESEYPPQPAKNGGLIERAPKKIPPKDGSTKPAWNYTAPHSVVQDMNQHASSLVTDCAAPAGLPVAGPAQSAADCAPEKPQKRMKKIKFLEPELKAPE